MGFLRIVVCQLGETSKKIGAAAASSLSIYTFLRPHQVRKKEGKNDPLNCYTRSFFYSYFQNQPSGYFWKKEKATKKILIYFLSGNFFSRLLLLMMIWIIISSIICSSSCLTLAPSDFNFRCFSYGLLAWGKHERMRKQNARKMVMPNGKTWLWDRTKVLQNGSIF